MACLAFTFLGAAFTYSSTLPGGHHLQTNRVYRTRENATRTILMFTQHVRTCSPVLLANHLWCRRPSDFRDLENKTKAKAEAVQR